jgi:hypothetical protein
MGFCSTQQPLYTVECSSPQTPKSTCLPTRRWMPQAVVALGSGPRRTGALPAGAVKSLSRWRACRVHSLSSFPLVGPVVSSWRCLEWPSVRRLRRLASRSVPSLEATLGPSGPAKCAALHPTGLHRPQVCAPPAPQELATLPPEPHECAALNPQRNPPQVCATNAKRLPKD